MELPPIFSKYRNALEEELREIVGQPTSPLRDMLSYQLDWTDEQGTPKQPDVETLRLHANLCLLTCDAISGQFEPALPAAAGVELIHHQSLVHEDVQVAHPDRNNRATVWWLWGPGQAINAGDGLHAMGRLALMRLQGRGQSPENVLRAMGALDRACMRMCEGQHIELVYQERLDVRVDPYLEMTAAKTGALMGCATELGALVASEGETPTDIWCQVGVNLGMAYQIREDILDLWGTVGQKPRIDNILSKKKNLPIVYALETADVSKKRELGTLYFKRVLEPEDVEHLVAVLDEVGARTYAEEVAESYYQGAMDLLNGLGMEKKAEPAFQEMGRYIVSRDT